MTVVSEARGINGLPPLEACEWAPPATPVTSEVGKKEKNEGSATKDHTLLLSLPGNTPALQLPLPNTLGGTKTLGHCPFPRPYNWEQLVQHLLWELSRKRCFLHGLQEVGANHHSYLWLQRWEWPATTRGP